MRPIETHYNGTTYRSRTEARWAFMFDLAQIEFQYEPESYKLYSGHYIPDFWIHPWQCFFEVKPAEVIIEAGYYCEERSLAEDLAHATLCDVIFGCGLPHVMLKLPRIEADGIPPKCDEWLTDRIPASIVARAMKPRYDWKKRAFVGGEFDDWQLVGPAGWRAYNGFKKGWPK